MHFIYVFDNESKESLLSLGFTLFLADDINRVFVFLNDPDRDFSGNVTEYVMTDSLTF